MTMALIDPESHQLDPSYDEILSGGGQGPGIRAGGGREAEDGAGCGSCARTGGEKRTRNVTFFIMTLSLFFRKRSKNRGKE